MKKVYQSFISILLVFSLLASMTLTSFATAKNNKVGDKVTLYEDHETIVEMYTDLSGNRILNQYLNGTLIQRDTLLTSSPNSIKRDFFDDSVTRKSSSDVIYIEQYGKLTSDNNERVQPCAVQTAGTIKYRAALDTGYIYYGLKCTYDTKNLGSTTYTINNFVGRMVDLIALVVGALTLPNIVAEAFLDALIKGLGITVASGMIKNAVTDTVSCIKTQYTWNLVDTTAASHQKNVYGYKYYITDVKSAAKNNNYYEGYVPKDWKTQSLAVNFHNEMFTYNAWNVVGWA